MNSWSGLAAGYCKPAPKILARAGTTCGACGIIFEVWRCDVGRRKYCSKPCQVIGFSRRKMGARVAK